jgi:hypothetical protein
VVILILVAFAAGVVLGMVLSQVPAVKRADIVGPGPVIVDDTRFIIWVKGHPNQRLTIMPEVAGSAEIWWDGKSMPVGRFRELIWP